MSFDIHLSQPELFENDFDFLKNIEENKFIRFSKDCISNFEDNLKNFSKSKYVVAMNSGTSSLHLGLLGIGLKPGDKVIVPTLTFAATAFPLKYLGVEPVFFDVSIDNWNLDLELLENYLKSLKQEEIPKAVIAVDLFGHIVDYDNLIQICNNFDIKLVIDAAESLGSRYNGKSNLNLGVFSITSFNNNKIITSSGGGALFTDDYELSFFVRKLANQARESVHWYEHTEIGYNYRLSPILAGLGDMQLQKLPNYVKKRQQIRAAYSKILDSIPGLLIKKDATWEKSNAWLTLLHMDPLIYPNCRDKLFESLAMASIECRFVWKPLHLQPVFSKNKKFLNGNSQKIYRESLCLPSSSNLSLSQVERVCDVIISSLKK
jgi:dTDP-4-amino-4,6-dideoxygalactose transaminase